MTCSDYIIEKNGKHGVRLALPRFSGEDLSLCARLNSFCESIAEEVCNYALTLSENESVRTRLFCSYELSDSDGLLIMILHFSYSVTGERSKRKTIEYRFRKGYAVSKSIR